MKNYKKPIIGIFLFAISVLSFVFGADIAEIHPFFSGSESGIDTGKGGPAINPTPLVVTMLCFSVWMVIYGSDKEDKQ